MTSEDPLRGDLPSTQRLSEAIGSLTFDELPRPVVDIVEQCFVDTVGVALAGSRDGAGSTAAAAVGSVVDEGGPATIMGRTSTASCTDAAFVNGTAAHGLDFDDVSDATHGHPSVTMIPGILALAETREVTGERAVTAYAAGFETQRYLGSFVEPIHAETGWHATATIGTFGAAGAAARLLELDAGQTRHALNIAASMPAGLAKNFGTMTKPMHAGQAARSGLTAAMLAAEGFTAADDAIWGERGFVTAYSVRSECEPVGRDVPTPRWESIADGIHFKKYPCCHYTHAAIAAATDLVDSGIDPADVRRIRVTASRGAASALGYDDPTTGLEGKFSMEYVVACAVALDSVGLAQFDDQSLSNSAVQRLRDRVELDVDPDLPYGSKRTIVAIETSTGTIDRVRDHPPGHADVGFSDEDLYEKFVRCAEWAGWRDDVAPVYERLRSLSAQESVSEIVRDLRGDS